MEGRGIKKEKKGGGLYSFYLLGQQTVLGKIQTQVSTQSYPSFHLGASQLYYRNKLKLVETSSALIKRSAPVFQPIQIIFKEEFHGIPWSCFFWITHQILTTFLYQTLGPLVFLFKRDFSKCAYSLQESLYKGKIFQ